MKTNEDPRKSSNYKVTINQVRPCRDHEDVKLATANQVGLNQVELLDIRKEDGVNVVKYVLGWWDSLYNITTNNGANTTFYAQPRTRFFYDSTDTPQGAAANVGGSKSSIPSLFCGTKITIEPHAGTSEDAGMVTHPPKHISRPNFIKKVGTGKGDPTLPDSEGFLRNDSDNYKQDLAEWTGFSPGYPTWNAPIHENLQNPKLMGDYKDPDRVAAVFKTPNPPSPSLVPGFAGKYEFVTQEMVDSSNWKKTGEGLLTSDWGPHNGFFGYYYAGARKVTRDRFTTSDNQALLVDPLLFESDILELCSIEVPNCDCGEKWTCTSDNPKKADTLACTGTYTKSANEYAGETLEGGLNKVQRKSNCDPSKGSCFQEFKCEDGDYTNAWQNRCVPKGDPHQTGDAPVQGYKECWDLCGKLGLTDDHDIYDADLCLDVTNCPQACYKCEVYADAGKPPVDIVEIGRGEELCSCKLGIRKLSATPTCDGEHLHVTWDMYDMYGIWKTDVHSSFPAHLAKDHIRVKCQLATMSTETD